MSQDTEGKKMVKKFVMALFLMAGLVLSSTSSVYAATCSTVKNPVQSHTTTGAVSWSRFTDDTFTTMTSGSAQVKATVTYYNCGGNNKVVKPYTVKICPLSYNLSNDPTATGFVGTGDTNDQATPHNYSWTNETPLNQTGCTNATYVNLFWFKMSDTPKNFVGVYPDMPFGGTYSRLIVPFNPSNDPIVILQ